MALVFFPSCQMKKEYPAQSARLAEYLERKLGVVPAGCCRVGHKQLTREDTALVLCHNCAAVTGENSAAGVEYVWQLIDRDPDFPFPDYGGETMILRDCGNAYDRPEAQEAVRSLLRKLNVTVEELPDNREKAAFCNTLLSPLRPENAALAPHRYQEQMAGRFLNLSPEEKQAWLVRYCAPFGDRKIVCWCRGCASALKAGGANAVHLIELLFPS